MNVNKCDRLFIDDECMFGVVMLSRLSDLHKGFKPMSLM